MKIEGRISGKLGAAALALALCVPTVAEARIRRAPRGNEAVTGLGAFTPAAADPRLAAAFARSGLGANNFGRGAFRFTPSGDSSRRRAVTVAIRARAAARAGASRTLALGTDGPSAAYNLGLSVGWKRFAISGDLTRIDTGPLGDRREAADVGLSFSGRRWATKIDLAADRVADSPLVGIDQSWSVGLGGTYALTHSINLSGGIRYKEQRDQFQSLLDDRRDSQTVYLGTTFKF